MKLPGLRQLTAFCLLWTASVQAEPLRLYIDADFSHGTQAADAIELGVRTALAESGNEVDGHSIEVRPIDHRGNVKRSLRTLQTYGSDPNALAVIGGVNSPPYLTNRRLINEEGWLMLLPWSAAGPITRSPESRENWIFRLSIDDTKSADFFVRRAIEVHDCKAPGLLLVDTGWGRVNRIALLERFSARSDMVPQVWTFPAAVGEAEAARIAGEIGAAGRDCLIMLASDNNGSLLVREMFRQNVSPRILSHWGITAGDFEKTVAHEIREEMRIEVLQTCALTAEQIRTVKVKRVLALAGQDQGGFQSLSDVPAMTGFVHAYDITRIFLAATGQAMQSPNWADADIHAKRRAVRGALENLQTPVDGILKTYRRPFRPFSQADADAHEALGGDDLCVAAYSASGHLVLPVAERGARPGQ
ncbi:ABC transporter substrate-binding protein [uncultured Roseobacter sp.]|uniref:ABC transporter substrate-binding protein n=1 Tax=uncultured Roseobacter sp. TaxID=114847 RepID=UPI00262894AA|nr:ABC transporter substrate-binding protein [uncultured Roseobacter sp.]